MAKQQIIQQGAEAIIYKIGNKIVKDRISKSYRFPELDNKIRKQRTKAEAKIISKLKNIINVPKILADPGTERMIHMEYIKGKKLSKHLEKLNYKKISKQIGESLTLLHNQDIIHGDLTTSNMIYVESNNNFKVYLIDFGLGFHSYKIEDKAVDLHLLQQALNAKHYKIAEECIKIILKNYKSKQYKEIIKRIKIIESRGRYKSKKQ